MSRQRSNFTPWAVLGLAGLVILTIWLFRTHTEPSVFDEDLLIVPQELEQTANGWNNLLEAARSLRWSSELSKRTGHFAASESWDASRVAAFLDDNQECLQWLDLALASDRIQVPRLNPLDDYDYLSDWRRLAMLALVRAENHFRQGDQAGGFHAALDVVRFTRRLQESDGALIHYLVATSINRQATDRIHWMTAQTTLPPEALLKFIRALESCGPNPSALTNALKMEYRLAKSVLTDIANGRVPMETNSPLNQMALRFGTTPFLKVAPSQERLAEICRASLADVARHYADGAAIRARQEEPERSTLIMMLSGNAVGELLIDLLALPWEKIAVIKCTDNVRHQATLCFLALKTFHARNGHLPVQLVQLVPDYLPELPIDDFDGQPLRYQPEDLLLYSVGTELADPLSQTDADTQDQRNKSQLVFRIAL